MSEEKVLTEIPSPMQTRAEFAEMVVKDLLGPAESAAEELDGRSVRDRYLVGVLVPRRQGAQPQLATERDEEFPPVLLDELEEDGTDGEEDGPKELSSPQPKATFPSSFGMTFCVSGDTQTIKATARWGQYLRVENGIWREA